MKVYRDIIIPSVKTGNVNELPYRKHNDGKWYSKSGDEVKIKDDSNWYVLWVGATMKKSDSLKLQYGKSYKLVEIPIAGSTESEASFSPVESTQVVFDIHKCTYTGTDMGERKVTATLKWHSPIDFKVGDYSVIQTQDLLRNENGANGGTDLYESFYIYTAPSIKKVARKESVGDAFETTVTFYPRQYELGCIQMRDVLQLDAQSDVPVIYTGFDQVTFIGGAKTLMDRIMAVLADSYHDELGNPLWNYYISDGVNEELNTALETYQLTFNGVSVMDALLELNNKDTINTTFFINGRTIFVGYKRPYFCGVDEHNILRSTPFNFEYGKTSHLPIETNYGCLYDITKSVGSQSPITKLYAYGAARNLNRYYCSDRIKTGRYVNRLMLPSFDDDGRTDYIISQEGVEKFGIREGSKTFDDIYPSLRFITYGDLRQIKYCIKIKGSGNENDSLNANGNLEKDNSYAYPIARVQCYKVIENADGTNSLVESAPPKDVAVLIHATGKVVKVVLYGGATNAEAIAKQIAKDYKVPTRDGQTHAADFSNVIPGSCFCVHDYHFEHETWAEGHYKCSSRDDWFDHPEWNDDNPGQRSEYAREIQLAQIEYVDTFWLTDLYWFDSYKQTYFNRDGISAWCWPRTNDNSIYPNTEIVNEVVEVEPIKIVDTSLNLAEGTYQQTFDVYLKDIGFRFDEQNDFGEMVFVYDDVVLSFLDGLLAGREYKFVVPNKFNWNAICAYNDDGTINNDFFVAGNYEQGQVSALATKAFNEGAFWRVTCAREVTDDSLGLILPMKGDTYGEINAKKGDHFVFLDIYMPDIYIHAAENRLLKEAQKYLESNDNCETNYAVTFDKVRPLQIPLYGLQMREGLNIRLIDEDLEITSVNNKKTIFDEKNGIGATANIGIGNEYIRIQYPIDFLAGKHYTMLVNETKEINGQDVLSHNYPLKLITNIGNEYIPDVTVVDLGTPEGKTDDDNIRLVKLDFDIPISFNDSISYYAYIGFNAEFTPSDATAAQAYLMKIVQSNIEDGESVLQYVDLKVESVTINFSDKFGEDDIPSRDVSATFKETTKASAWVSLMNKVEQNAIEGDNNKTSYESIANIARKHYREILSLRDRIFDPDGTCDQTFLQVMMMQVGADSMNYGLFPVDGRDRNEYTHEDLNGNLLWGVLTTNNSNRWYVELYQNKLKHYVYTEGAQGGSWLIGSMSGNPVMLGTTTEHPTYYVCIKCSRDGNVGEWVIDTDQHPVDEENDYWYFNFGIITYEDGTYHFSETRGNAYMYGDNLVVGKISSLSRQCWFDLTNGEFVLGDGNGTALSFQNGKLTIAGMNKEIGGENLFAGDKELSLYESSTEIITLNVQDGDIFVISAEKIEVNGGYGYVKISTSAGITHRFENDGYLYPSDDRPNDVLHITSSGELKLYLRSDGLNSTAIVYGLMIQKGEKYTSYQEYVKHITNALQQSTTIEGGLVSTSLIQLYNEIGNEIAGLSGLSDDTNGSQGVTLYSGGTYENALKQAKGLLDVLPILITKTGFGSKIGCFRVEDEHTISITNPNGKIILDSYSGITFYENINGDLKKRLFLSLGNIQLPGSGSSTLLSSYNFGTNNYNEGVFGESSQDQQIYDGKDAPYVLNIGNTYCDIKITPDWDDSVWINRSYYSVEFTYLMFNSTTQESIVLKKISETDITLVNDKITRRIHADNGYYPNLANPGDWQFGVSLIIKRRKSHFIPILETWWWDKKYKLDDSGTCSFNITSGIAFYRPTDAQYTEIGKDGIVIANSSSNYVMIKNNGVSTDVRFSGLPNSNAGLISGQLWRDNTDGTIHIV